MSGLKRLAGTYLFTMQTIVSNDGTFGDYIVYVFMFSLTTWLS
jgi:hypothetical protein